MINISNITYANYDPQFIAQVQQQGWGSYVSIGDCTQYVTTNCSWQMLAKYIIVVIVIICLTIMIYLAYKDKSKT